MNWNKIRFGTGFFIMVAVFINMARMGIAGFSAEHATLPEQVGSMAAPLPTPHVMIYLALVLLVGLLFMLSGLPVEESHPTVVIHAVHLPILDDDDEEETHDDEADDGDGGHRSKKPKEDTSREDVPPKESPKQEGGN